MKRTRNIYHYQYNKCRKVQESIRKNKLIDACLDQSDGNDLFKEIKNMRNTKQVVATTYLNIFKRSIANFTTLLMMPGTWP